MSKELDNKDFVIICNGNLLYAGDEVNEAMEAANKMVKGIENYWNHGLWTRETDWTQEPEEASL